MAKARKQPAGMNPLALDSQLCFPLYTAARVVTARYTPFLKALDLTYTQYICMMVLWEEHQLAVKDIAARLHLDSGTLTPLLKKLEAKGYLTRERSRDDERRLDVTITEAGMALRERALEVPQQMGACIDLDVAEAIELRTLLEKLIAGIDGSWEAQ